MKARRPERRPSDARLVDGENVDEDNKYIEKVKSTWK